MRCSALLGVLWLVVTVHFAAGCVQSDTKATTAAPPAAWVSRAIPEGQGEIKTLPDGKRQAVRYPGWTTEDFGRFRTYAYDDHRPEIPVSSAPMPAVAGNANTSRRLFLHLNLLTCPRCHLCLVTV